MSRTHREDSSNSEALPSPTPESPPPRYETLDFRNVPLNPTAPEPPFGLSTLADFFRSVLRSSPRQADLPNIIRRLLSEEHPITSSPGVDHLPPITFTNNSFSLEISDEQDVAALPSYSFLEQPSAYPPEALDAVIDFIILPATGAVADQPENPHETVVPDVAELTEFFATDEFIRSIDPLDDQTVSAFGSSLMNPNTRYDFPGDLFDNPDQVRLFERSPGAIMLILTFVFLTVILFMTRA